MARRIVNEAPAPTGVEALTRREAQRILRLIRDFQDAPESETGSQMAEVTYTRYTNNDASQAGLPQSLNIEIPGSDNREGLGHANTLFRQSLARNGLTQEVLQRAGMRTQLELPSRRAKDEGLDAYTLPLTNERGNPESTLNSNEFMRKLETRAGCTLATARRSYQRVEFFSAMRSDMAPIGNALSRAFASATRWVGARVVNGLRNLTRDRYFFGLLAAGTLYGVDQNVTDGKFTTLAKEGLKRGINDAAEVVKHPMESGHELKTYFVEAIGPRTKVNIKAPVRPEANWVEKTTTPAPVSQEAVPAR